MTTRPRTPSMAVIMQATVAVPASTWTQPASRDGPSVSGVPSRPARRGQACGDGPHPRRQHLRRLPGPLTQLPGQLPRLGFVAAAVGFRAAVRAVRGERYHRSWPAARRARRDRRPVAGHRHARPHGQLEAGQRPGTGGCVEPGHAVRPGLAVLPGLAAAHRDPERRVEAELRRPPFQGGREQGRVPGQRWLERPHVAQSQPGQGQHGAAGRVDRASPAIPRPGQPRRSARTCTAPRTSAPETVSALEPGREHPAVRDAGLQHVHDGVVQPRAAQHQRLVQPRRAGPWRGSGPAGLRSADPGRLGLRCLNQGRSSAPRIRAEHEREVTSGRNATRRNGPAWKNTGPYRSVPSTMPPAEATVSPSRSVRCWLAGRAGRRGDSAGRVGEREASPGNG